jgi:uncharacterized protein (TIGR03032 family)
MHQPNDTGVETLASVHTTGFPELLRALGASLLVSTYQAGKLLFMRAAGETLNVHFRHFARPMGVAFDGRQLAVGGQHDIRTFANLPEVAASREPAGSHDACFLPRQIHITGNIAVHELAWGSEGLWLVNTRFSCLCTLDPSCSFVPRWAPPFISELRPEDRCHLNGLALVDGRPRYATALGASDAPAGWRQRKRDGGVLIDCASDEVIAAGLSMPHSPRWRDGRLWLLNSGEGSIGVVDLASGRYEPVARLPGFTRGLDFCGRYAFVGLSRVRESATFSGIAIADAPLEQRACGVWVVDTVTGRTVAFVRFDAGVDEIFAVQALPQIRFPDLVDDEPELLEHTFVVPDDALARFDPQSRGITNGAS